MPLYFLDTSVLLKLYLREPGSRATLQVAASPDSGLAVATLGALELRAALRGKQRRGELTPTETEEILEHFRRQLESRLVRQPLNDQVLEVTAMLLDRHPLRAPDALQLGACVVLHQTLRGATPIFACSDRALLQAARDEMIPCWDPVAEEERGGG